MINSAIETSRVLLTTLTACLLLSGCATGVRPLPTDAVEFLRANRQPLAIGDSGVGVGADLLGEADVYLLGESHGVAANEAIDFALLTYLHETEGIRTYLTEAGYGAGLLYDSYVQTNDRRILDQVFSSLRGTSAWTSERYAFWERLASFNVGKLEADRIRVLGLDVEHQYAVGIGLLVSLIPEEVPPEEIRAEVEAVRAIVTENAWSVERCRAVAEALNSSIGVNREFYTGYLGGEAVEAFRILDSLLDGFAYRTGRGSRAENDRDRSMYDRFIDLAAEYPGPYYGKFGAEHIHQREYRGLRRFGGLIAGPGSPFADRVASILMVYDGGTRLARGRDGSWAPAPLESPSRLLGPLTAAADPGEAVVVFRLTGEPSPMSDGLYLLEAPSDGGATTDYVQNMMLVRGAESSTLFERRGE